MTKAEITRALRKYRYDPDYEMPDVLGHRAANSRPRKDRRTGKPNAAIGRLGERIVPISCIAALSRLSAKTMKWAQRGIMTETTRAALSPVIDGLESGRVRFVRNRERHGPRWSVEYHDPPSRPPRPRDKLTRAADWIEWSRCRNCGGQRWEAVACHGAFFYACATCLPREQWPAMGARPIDVKQRLEMPEQAMREDFSFIREGKS